MNDRRTSNRNTELQDGLAKLTKSKAEVAELSYKELNRALHAVVASNGPLDLVEALIAMAADVDVARRASSDMWKKLTGKDQPDQETEVVQIPT